MIHKLKGNSKFWSKNKLRYRRWGLTFTSGSGPLFARMTINVNLKEPKINSQIPSLFAPFGTSTSKWSLLSYSQEVHAKQQFTWSLMMRLSWVESSCFSWNSIWKREFPSICQLIGNEQEGRIRLSSPCLSSFQTIKCPGWFPSIGLGSNERVLPLLSPKQWRCNWGWSLQ
jgi:hypothetical protein